MNELIAALLNVGVSGKNVQDFRSKGDKNALYAGVGYVISAVVCVAGLLRRSSTKRRSHRHPVRERVEKVLNGFITIARIFLAI